VAGFLISVILIAKEAIGYGCRHRLNKE